MDPIFALLLGASVIALCVFAWCTRVPGAWRSGRRLRMWSDPEPEEYERRQAPIHLVKRKDYDDAA